MAAHGPVPGGNVNGKPVAEGKVPVSVPLLFTAPFKFNGKIARVHVKYIDAK